MNLDLKKINQLRKGKEGKKLVGNFVSLAMLQVASYIFPLLTIPYLAHVIGVDKYGELVFASSIMIYFQTVVDYGFNFSSVRDIARCKENLQEASAIYSRVMWSRFALVFLAFLILVILIILIPKFQGMQLVLLASFMMVIGYALFPEWMFQAVEKMKYITIFNVIIKLLFTLAVFIFIRQPSDYILQPIFSAMGYILSGVGAMWLIHKWGFKIGTPKLKEIKKGITSNFDLFLNQIVPNLYNSASVILLGFLHGDAANGIFGAANRFNQAGTNLFSIISRTFYPFLSRRMDKHNFFKVLNVSIASAVGLALFLLAPLIIHKLFPADFDGAIITLRIISISLVFLALNNVFGTNFLILKGYERKMRVITLWTSITGLIIGIPMVYYWSYVGVALTVTLSRGILGFWSMFEAKKIQRQEKTLAGAN